MDDAPPNRKPSWLDRLGALLMREPEDREHLVELLRSAHSRNLLDGEALSMIEGALQVSEMKVREVMIPRAPDGRDRHQRDPGPVRPVDHRTGTRASR